MRAELQSDLEVLRSDRPEDASEIFPPNSWYGAASAIRKASGWPSHRPLPLVLPHGVELSANFIYRGEVENSLPAIFSFPAYRDDVYRAATDKRVIPGCAPWLYVPRPDYVAERTTILLMPAHSSAGVAADMNDELFAQTVEDLYPGEQLQCCIYWRDFQLSRHEVYLNRSIPVVSAGHAFDSRFFSRLAGLFATAKLVVTNDFGSHVFYAASHDVPVLVVSEVPVEWAAPEDVLSRSCATGPLADTFKDIAPLFRESAPDIARQRPAAQLMLGAERMLNEVEMSALMTDLWRTPGFRSQVLARWQVKRWLAPARGLLQR